MLYKQFIKDKCKKCDFINDTIYKNKIKQLEKENQQAKRIIKKLWDYHRQSQYIISHQIKLNKLGGYYGKRLIKENEKLKTQIDEFKIMAVYKKKYGGNDEKI